MLQLGIDEPAQLIDASNGYHLWSDRYDRELTDVFEVQDEIAAAITGALRLTLAPPTPRPLRRDHWCSGARQRSRRVQGSR